MSKQHQVEIFETRHENGTYKCLIHIPGLPVSWQVQIAKPGRAIEVFSANNREAATSFFEEVDNEY